MAQKQKKDPITGGISSVLPDHVLIPKRFLLWKAEGRTAKGKPKRIPYYSDGSRRWGDMDTPEDIGRLETYQVVAERLGEGGYSGIGFAVTNEGIAAFDVDGCLDDEGNLLPDHAGVETVETAELLGAYIERSPSGRGLRILGAGKDLFPYSRDGLEFWAEKRFLTLTGDVWANPKGWIDLTALRLGLGPSRRVSEEEGQHEEDEYGDYPDFVTNETYAELRSALVAIPSDEEETFTRITYALKTLPDEGKAKRMWDEWAKKGRGYNLEENLRRWERQSAERTSYKSIFVSAAALGWVNPKSRKGKLQRSLGSDAEEEGEEGVDQYAHRAVNLGDHSLQPTEFVVDGFLPRGLVVVAGAWGAGKSTNLIPIMASTAHLTPPNWAIEFGIKSEIRRKVVWVTEAPEQARETLYSLSGVEGAKPWDEMKEWFYIYRSARETAGDIVKFIRNMLRRFTYPLDNGFEVLPLFVLDTTTANIELENESDNSEVGAVMAVLKQKLHRVPIILIGHTPKNLTRADVADLTFRGAGAWEAEAEATYFLAYDAETDMRFMAIRKARFTPSFREINFGHEGGSETVDTAWGEPQTKTYLHGVPSRSSGEERQVARQEIRENRREEVKEQQLSQRQQRILAVVTETVAENKAITRNDIKKNLGMRAGFAVEALDRLIEANRLKEVEWPDGVRPASQGVRSPVVLPFEVEPSDFFKNYEPGTLNPETP